jgi:hypothetical protein
VHLLDDWLRRNYRLARRLFHYDVLVPRLRLTSAKPR